MKKLTLVALMLLSGCANEYTGSALDKAWAPMTLEQRIAYNDGPGILWNNAGTVVVGT